MAWLINTLYMLVFVLEWTLEDEFSPKLIYKFSENNPNSQYYMVESRNNSYLQILSEWEVKPKPNFSEQ